MSTDITVQRYEGVYLIAVQNSVTDYLKWQRDMEKSSIYFEWEAQENSGYDVVMECTLDRDGIHIVLHDGLLVHFYFYGVPKSQWDNLVQGLKDLYIKEPAVVFSHY